MLKKGEHFTQNAMAQRKAKNISDHNQSYADANKENFSTKSLFEHGQSEVNSKLFKTGQQSNYGSTMVSPTFQSNNIVSLKQQIYKQNNPNKGFKQVNLSLIDYTEKMDFKQQMKQNKIVDHKKIDQLALQKERLVEHYKNKKYWSKIQKLFQQEGVDAVLAWEDSIKKYKTIKDKLESLQNENQELKKQLSQRNQKLINLEKHMAIEKNETRVLSQKKCRGCQNLQLKQKEYFELYQQSKKQTKQIKELEQALNSSSKQFTKMQQRYLQEKGIKQQMQKRRALLKEQLDKKSQKLQQKEKIEKQMLSQLQKLQGEQRKNSKLHIQFEQLKQFKYQAEKTIGKVEEKSKKEINEYQQRIKQLQQERNIYQNETNKLRNELSQLRPKILKAQLEIQDERSSKIMKVSELDELKKKHIDSMSQEIRKRSQLENSLRGKEDELNRAYQMIDQAENIKTKLQFQLSHERKNIEEKVQQICKYLQIIKQLEQKCKEIEQQDCRSKQSNYFYNFAKTKNPNSCNIQQYQQGSTSLNLNKKMQMKISQIFFKMKQINEDGMDSLQRRKSREEQIQEKQYANSFQLEKYVNYIHSELSRFINKYEYFQKEKDILRRNTQDQLQCKDIELEIMKKQVSVKERVISSLVSFIPEDMKDSALGFLELAEYCSTRDQEQNQLDDQFQQMRESLQNEGRAWRQNYQRMKFKFRKLEDDLQKLQEQNEQLKRKTKGKQVKKTFTTDYDCYREGVTKKDIRKKYNFD